ncbi:MAG TPA: hypothetical protein PLR07_13625, partial [Promineifilum sp.]|nr:hypothetical protein [Promineifilum sp.]
MVQGGESLRLGEQPRLGCIRRRVCERYQFVQLQKIVRPADVVFHNVQSRRWLAGVKVHTAIDP